MPATCSDEATDHHVRAFTAAGTDVAIQGLRLRGSVFIDGSCTRHPVKDLCRASFAVVMVNSGGIPVISVLAPVWSHLPQTPQAAEYCAYAGAASFFLYRQGVLPHSGCFFPRHILKYLQQRIEDRVQR